MKFKVGDIIKKIENQWQVREVEDVQGTYYQISDPYSAGYVFDTLNREYVESTYELASVLDSPLYKAIK